MKSRGCIVLCQLLFLPAVLPVCLAARVTCDQEVLAAAKQEFLRLRDLRRQAPKFVSEPEFRAVSERYVELAEDCYQALQKGDPRTGHIIDTGGLWAGGIRPRHNLHGTKWGADSPFLTQGENPDATGPRSPGGEVSFSYMADDVDLTDDCGAGCVNTSIYSSVFTDSAGDTEQARCMQREVAEAFAAWSAIADITFTPVADNGAAFDAGGASGEIRIGFHPFDGAFGVLAHAFFPPPNGTSAAGDIHFDLVETWSCGNDPGTIDFGIVALHEIGHALGLRHETGGDTAVMNPAYNAALNFGPTADDIIGAGEIYDGSPIGGHYFFGNVGIGTDSPQSRLHILENDGSANLRVEEISSTPSTRTLYTLANNGGIRFEMRNTSGSGSIWQFSGLTNFNIDTNTNPGNELQVRQNGDLVIGGSLFANGGADVFPDYVFDQDYRLMPLEELAEFVRREKHLPKISSSQQVRQQGMVNMTELQLKLLEKVEELSLYIIQQQEQIKSLRRRNTELEMRLLRLEALQGPEM